MQIILFIVIALFMYLMFVMLVREGQQIQSLKKSVVVEINRAFADNFKFIDRSNPFTVKRTVTKCTSGMCPLKNIFENVRKSKSESKSESESEPESQPTIIMGFGIEDEEEEQQEKKEKKEEEKKEETKVEQ